MQTHKRGGRPKVIPHLFLNKSVPAGATRDSVHDGQGTGGGTFRQRCFGLTLFHVSSFAYILHCISSCVVQCISEVQPALGVCSCLPEMRRGGWLSWPTPCPKLWNHCSSALLLWRCARLCVRARTCGMQVWYGVCARICGMPGWCCVFSHNITQQMMLCVFKNCCIDCLCVQTMPFVHISILFWVEIAG